MKRLCLLATLLGATLLLSASAPKNDYGWIKAGIETARVQLLAAAQQSLDSDQFPCSVTTHYSLRDWNWQMGRTMAENTEAEEAFPPRLHTWNFTDWRSGFFPGSLWLTWEFTGDPALKEMAEVYTKRMEPIRTVTGTHDIGFMAYCSYGQALRLSPADSVVTILHECADNLCTRFNPTIGCLRSWDSRKWNFAVIIDNMMNLEILFHESAVTGDPKYRDIAVRHAYTTMKNHFRRDGTTWHVVSYNDDGTIQTKCTAQGLNDDSAWSRGQAWGFYGYTMSYRETGDKAFRRQALRMARMIMRKVRTEDAIPYWDYDAPVDPRTPRDASAAAITASAMIELSTLVPCGRRYFRYGEKILHSLSSPAYLAKPQTNFNFVLKHSVSGVPTRSEVDAALNYADYYYLEALGRYMAVKGLSYKDL